MSEGPRAASAAVAERQRDLRRKLKQRSPTTRTVAKGNEKALSIAESFFQCVFYEEYRTFLEE